MRTKVDVTIETIYKSYCKEYGKVDKKEFKLVLYTLNKLIATYMLEGLTIKLPHSLSTIGIRKRKMQFVRVYCDFAEYNRTGIKSVYLNQHSDEMYAFPYWCKSKSRVPNKKLYRFDLSRDNKRKLASIMKQKNGHHVYETIK